MLICILNLHFLYFLSRSRSTNVIVLQLRFLTLHISECIGIVVIIECITIILVLLKSICSFFHAQIKFQISWKKVFYLINFFSWIFFKSIIGKFKCLYVYDSYDIWYMNSMMYDSYVDIYLYFGWISLYLSKVSYISHLFAW